MSEAKVRKLLRERNIILKKDRRRYRTWDHQGDYMVIGFTDSGTRIILAGNCYDYSLEDVYKEFILES